MRLLPFALLFLPAMARAEVPVVAVDIAPVHSLVARVMQGVGTPDLVIPPGASPHGYAMRPSEARSLSKADLVVWVGAGLTPWLAEPLDALAPNARKLALMEAEGVSLLAFREGVGFEGGHDHDHAAHDDEAHGDDAHDGHDHAAEGHEEHAHKDDGHEGHAHDDGHEDHDDHKDHAGHDGHEDHAEHEGHEDHDGHDNHEGHAHGGSADARDPHIWLDPENAAASLSAIAQALAALDPENAAIYRENAKDGRAEMEILSKQIAQRLQGAKGRSFIVFHDAFHYFEARFDVEAIAAVSAGDAATPGPARVSTLRTKIESAAPVCAFAEPQMNTSLLQTVLEGQSTKLATLDPLGVSLPLGPDLYPDLMLVLGGAIADCLAP
ncbi:zinc ABC transporter substrate-binding protein [Sulfitobacter geojensis]|uniref:zinc ABC transporter substrate-binding protein n=1 Tax=Sulfitobacter geojensis TaxID=1342299 RepID=UPI0024939F1B|nr:zinc ABC transporter substrate-binding protein [Sulfitobacter geojensis]